MSQITKRALEQSLKNLLREKPLSKITVTDITEDCGISRMAFYYHFKDIYALIEWPCVEDARRALEKHRVDLGRAAAVLLSTARFGNGVASCDDRAFTGLVFRYSFSGHVQYLRKICQIWFGEWCAAGQQTGSDSVVFIIAYFGRICIVKGKSLGKKFYRCP